MKRRLYFAATLLYAMPLLSYKIDKSELPQSERIRLKGLILGSMLLDRKEFLTKELVGLENKNSYAAATNGDLKELQSSLKCALEAIYKVEGDQNAQRRYFYQNIRPNIEAPIKLKKTVATLMQLDPASDEYRTNYSGENYPQLNFIAQRATNKALADQATNLWSGNTTEHAKVVVIDDAITIYTIQAAREKLNRTPQPESATLAHIREYLTSDDGKADNAAEKLALQKAAYKASCSILNPFKYLS